MPDETSNSFSRRDFLGLGAAAAALGGLTPTSGHAQQRPADASSEAPERRRTGRFGETEPSATLTAQLEALAAGRTTSAALVDAALSRIVAMDRQGPRLQAMLDLNPEARAIAAERDAERQAGRLRGPLHGVPIVIKDNVDTGDQMSTTAGSLALAGTSAGTDATVAAKLRAAGAILLGKTNLSEWANFRSTRSSSGWSARGGQTRNPYALDRSPSGSSSGSGSAIAAGYVGGAIGTETDGSIVSPAAANGLVGVKPTVGLVSRAGIIPISHTQDTAGPMTTTVRDAALLLGAIAGSDPRDAATLRRSAPAVDYVAALKPDALRGARIGVSRKGFFGFHAETDAVAETALQALKDAGAVLVDPAEIVTAQAFGEAEFDVLLFEFKADLEAYLARRGPDVTVRTLADLQAFNERERASELPWFGQEIVELALKKGPLTSPAYRKALAHCKLKSQREGLDATFARHRVEAVVMPTQGPAWVIDLIKGDAFGGGGASSVPAVAGYPHVTVPMGQVHGLPVGLSFVGPAWSEARLLAFAHAFEQATMARRAPTYAPSTLQMLGV